MSYKYLNLRTDYKKYVGKPYTHSPLSYELYKKSIYSSINFIRGYGCKVDNMYKVYYLKV